MLRRNNLVRDQRMEVFVKNFVLAIGQFLKASKSSIQRLVATKFYAQLLQTTLECVAP